MARKKLRQLYKNIGGEPRLQEILEDFYNRMSKDILIGYFFTGKDTRQIAHQQMAFLLQAMGVSTTYAGKPPTQAHGNLPPILAGHFDRRIVILGETLRDHGLSESDTKTWINFEKAFRKAIVVPEGPLRPGS
ncbi:MAG: group 1 truncated hemoglobin [Bdellovibrionia bacterium]